MLATLRRPLILAASVVVAITACATPTTPDAAPANVLAGVWEMARYNGVPLPLPPSNGVALVAHRLNISATGHFTEAFTLRLQSSGDLAITGPEGSYTLNGSAVSLSYEGGVLGTGTVTGTVDGETLVLAGDGRLLVFVRHAETD